MAPGPLSPVTERASAPSQAGATAGTASEDQRHAAAAAARVPPQLDTVPQGEQEMQSSQEEARNGDEQGSIATATGASHAASSSAALPKTCLHCGRIMETGSEDGGGNGSSSSSSSSDISGARTGARAAAALPSPSSVAFAPPNQQALSDAASITAMLAATPAVQGAIQMEVDRHQICQACLASVVALHSSRQTALHGSASDRVAVHQAQGDAQSSGQADVVMGEADPQQPHTMHAEDTSQDARQAPPRVPAISSSGPAWNRRAPWARVQAQRQGGGDLALPVEEAQPLSISVGNMGVGGDAVHYTANDCDFPPLASPTPTTSAAVLTPRIPPSPSRGRTTSSSGTPGSSHAARTPSFSRTQTTSSGGGPAFAAAVASASIPVVKFPARGRSRTGSSSGFAMQGDGVLAGSSASQGRRMSGARRLSRSSSAQGSLPTSFGTMGEMVSGSAIVEDEMATDVAPSVGPHAMTRPRLSLLTMSEIEKILLQNNADGVDAHSDKLVPSAWEKPFVQDIGHAETQKVSSALESVRESRVIGVQQLQWFDAADLDPMRDISRLRCKPRGRGCLFPGSTFRGTQQSGRMCYDVTVQIVNVDLDSSYLCGYLNIRGLTDDWPELTTYFDADIIGLRHGFVTGKWGATEADDMKHWSRFTPFRPIRSSLTKPDLRFNHLNKPYVFMRWKERFLVPDHRVRDINGASFAGFYYVCVELGEEPGAEQSSSGLFSPSVLPTSPGMASLSPTRRRRSSASFRRPTVDVVMDGQGDAHGPQEGSNQSFAHRHGVSAGFASSDAYGPSWSDAEPIQSGRMSGFYFHENSEPYQRLTLRHVPQTSSSSFEMR